MQERQVRVPAVDLYERRFLSRHYIVWDRACYLCGRKVVVSGAIKREIDADPATVLVCGQCALMDAAMESVVELGPRPDEACATCAMLKQ